METESEIKIPNVWESIFSRLYETPENSQNVEVSPDLSELHRANVSEARVVVFGGNRVGKSTFNKWIINKLLDNAAAASSDDQDPFVVYIDLDPGQAEFTPPGVISVLRITDHVNGPNLSHLTTPILSKFIGSLNVSDCVQTYLRCTEEIFQFLNSDESYKNVPWVVNTMGFSRGLGVLLANLTICLSNPNVVIQIGLDGVQGEDKRTFPWLLKEDAVRNYVNNNLRSDRHRINANSLKAYQFISINSVFCDLLEHVRSKLFPGLSPFHQSGWLQ
ncbi:unnamed protein product [Allacma fusca]|uniref:Clp1 P-loop domain-containing protein n=1 Tax=Allacma fusca TaxID=39272 RepID=A0A8J2KH20_9HEXA|nr:unnamed protein product [Allacma fusca]